MIWLPRRKASPTEFSMRTSLSSRRAARASGVRGSSPRARLSPCCGTTPIRTPLTDNGLFSYLPPSEPKTSNSRRPVPTFPLGRDVLYDRRMVLDGPPLRPEIECKRGSRRVEVETRAREPRNAVAGCCSRTRPVARPSAVFP